MGRVQESLECCAAGAALAHESGFPGARVFVGRAELALGDALERAGDWEPALAAYERARAMWAEALGQRHMLLAGPLVGASGALARLGRGREALARLGEAEELLCRALGREQRDVAAVRMAAGAVHVAQRRYTKVAIRPDCRDCRTGTTAAVTAAVTASRCDGGGDGCGVCCCGRETVAGRVSGRPTRVYPR